MSRLTKDGMLMAPKVPPAGTTQRDLYNEHMFRLGSRVNMALPYGAGANPTSEHMRCAATKLGVSLGYARKAFCFWTYGD